MRVFAYPAKEIVRDVTRSALGMLFSLVPLLLFRPSSVIVYILAGLAVMFAAYGGRALVRKKMKVKVSADGISVEGLKGKNIDWEALEALKLSYFSTRRDGEKGWMQLKLKGRGTGLTFESTISDFEDLVRLCAIKAKEAGVSFDATTARNLKSLDISVEDAAQTFSAYEGN